MPAVLTLVSTLVPYFFCAKSLLSTDCSRVREASQHGRASSVLFRDCLQRIFPDPHLGLPCRQPPPRRHPHTTCAPPDQWDDWYKAIGVLGDGGTDFGLLETVGQELRTK